MPEEKLNVKFFGVVLRLSFFFSFNFYSIVSVQYVVLGPDEKDVNEYFLSKKRGSELKFVLLVAVTFY